MLYDSYLITRASSLEVEHKTVMDDLEAMETIEGNEQNEAIELALDEEMDFNQQVFSHMLDIKHRTSPSSSADSLPALHQQAKLLSIQLI